MKDNQERILLELVGSLEDDLDEQDARIEQLERHVEELENLKEVPWVNKSPLDDILFDSLNAIVEKYENVVDRATFTEMEVAKYIARRYSGMEVEWKLILMAIVMQNIESWKDAKRSCDLGDETTPDDEFMQDFGTPAYV